VFWFLLKVTCVMYLFILVRGTLPRMRYDRLMNFGWKYLIPFGLFWVLATGAIIVLPERYTTVVLSIGGFDVTRGTVIAIGSIVAVWLIGSLIRPFLSPPREEASV
jgi:hypothetical protein